MNGTLRKSMNYHDHKLFPALHESWLRRRVPTYYYISYARKYWVCLDVEGFYVPHDVAERLAGLYHAYADWWFAKENPLRKKAPGLGLPDFHGDAMIIVLREHAPWWIELFNQAAPLLADHYIDRPWQPLDAKTARAHEQRMTTLTPNGGSI